jgi:predicted transcriptional regulator
MVAKKEKPERFVVADAKRRGCPLWEWRKRRGITLGVAADLLGVARITVVKWEAGDAMPSSEYVGVLSETLGMDAVEMLDRWIAWRRANGKIK